MRKVVVAGRKLAVDASAAIGKGGEADVFALRDGRALKLFKGPDHPDLAGQPALQDAARARLAEHQDKLRRLPGGLPAAVVAPEDLAHDPASGAVVGYAMRLVPAAEVLMRFGERAHRDRVGLGAGDVVRLFDALAGTVRALHRAGVVVGDFNDLNVLVSGGGPHLIDADSMQWGAWPCRAFTERFLDPALADRTAPRPVLLRAYGPDADWYAFTVMLFRTLLLMDPFGGVHRPADPARRVPHPARSLRGLSVLRPDVQLPKAAHPLEMLPDAALDAFRQVLEGTIRSPLALERVRQLRWTTCTACGLEHGRASCPSCHVAPPVPALPPQEVVRGEVTARRIVAVRGAQARILAASVDGARVRWLAFESGELRREDGRVAAMPADLARLLSRDRGLADVSVAFDADALVVATRDAVHRIAPDGTTETASADPVAQGGAASVACAGGALCWQDQGRLLRRGVLGPESIGEVLAGQTRIWTAAHLGFGVSRAGALSIAFLFDPRRRGLDDGVALPRVRGRVVDERVAIGFDRVWHLVREAAGARLATRCTVVDRAGRVVATREAADGDDLWLASARAVAAAGPWLFAVTDDGIVRVGAAGGSIEAVACYPDTAPFVADPCELHVGDDGLYVVGAREIQRLTMRAA